MRPTEYNDYDNTDSDDPDYREDSDEFDEDDLPRTMGRDRAAWIERNHEAIAELFRSLKRDGSTLFGNSFLQCGGTINTFANYIYKYSTPGAGA